MACHLEKAGDGTHVNSLVYAKCLVYANSLAFQSSPLQTSNQIIKAAYYLL
jgi:hypothetical protein